MGWSYNFWKGSFYPDGLDSSEFLAYYSKQFDTVEVDNTFYRIPREQTVLDWRNQTPPGFLFSLKFPQKITHIKMLRNADEETAVFLERVGLLGEKLGPLLLQLPPNFNDDGLVFIGDFLGKLPNRFRYVVAVRNRAMLCPELYKILREHKVSLAWAESAINPAVTEVTGGLIYVRWEGDRKKVKGTLGKTEVDNAADVRSWVSRLRPFFEKRIDVFGYFSKYYSGLPTTDAKQFLGFANAASS